MERKRKDLEVVNAVQKEEVSRTTFVVITINNVDEKYLEETRELFSPFYNRTLTDGECIEIINNMLNAECQTRSIKEMKEVI
ncbi:hypothetical protein [Candidatus Ruminimicrobiellum ovillum]|uniref:hypothetical protein n=1 Tax=Candidatus Ruminimicrobiellum ovillum TaxID=1947927 RepID=UPI00355ABC14